MDHDRGGSLAQHGARRPITVLPWGVILAAFGVVIAGTIGILVWLLDVAGDDPNRRLEAIKTAFTVGLGGGGTLALLLAVRRQWLQERAQIHAEAVAADAADRAERIAVASEHDAVERRVTELYIKAVDQLGSAQAPVRLAGLYALERLGQGNPDHRQTIGNVICAYLRMPYRPPVDRTGADASAEAAPVDVVASADPPDRHSPREELQVRLTAQRILQTHLSDQCPAVHWPQVDVIDLTGAHLVDFSFQHCHIPTLELNGATFTGEAIFRALHCGMAFIQNAMFLGHTDFRGAVFTDHAWFGYATFASDVWFHADQFHPGTQFGAHVSFREVTFEGHANLSHVHFGATADFTKVVCARGPQALELDLAQVNDPNALSPEVPYVPSVWPPDWHVEAGASGTGGVLARIPETAQCTTTTSAGRRR